MKSMACNASMHLCFVASRHRGIADVAEPRPLHIGFDEMGVQRRPVVEQISQASVVVLQ